MYIRCVTNRELMDNCRFRVDLGKKKEFAKKKLSKLVEFQSLVQECCKIRKI